MSRPVLLDLYCHAGGAARGYHDAGFDIEPMPEYPYEFHQDDAVDFLRRHGREFDAHHGSPPCLPYSNLNAYNHKEYPRLIAATRDAMIKTSRPWVIENVEQALSEMINPITLCGPMFGLSMYRHRLFETSFPLVAPTHPRHAWLCSRNGYLPTPKRPFMSIHGGKHSRAWQRRAAEVMGTPWITTIQGVCQAIPPRYASYVGAALLSVVRPTYQPESHCAGDPPVSRVCDRKAGHPGSCMKRCTVTAGCTEPAGHRGRCTTGTFRGIGWADSESARRGARRSVTPRSVTRSIR